MIRVRRTAATEVSVSSANEFDIWIAAESGTNNWTAAGYMAVVHDLCMLVGLLAVWRTSRWVTERTTRGSKALDGDLERCHTNVPRKFMITRDALKLYIADRTLELTFNSISELLFSLRFN